MAVKRKSEKKSSRKPKSPSAADSLKQVFSTAVGSLLNNDGYHVGRSAAVLVCRKALCLARQQTRRSHDRELPTANVSDSGAPGRFCLALERMIAKLLTLFVVHA